jgi:hypothetical protein
MCVPRRSAGQVFVVAALGLLSACGGGGGTTPTPTPTPTSITITSTGASLYLGATETFTATLTLSNGTTQAVTGGAWSSDATAVATVGASTGAVLGVANGEVTIIVDSQGVRGTKRIRVVPKYQGIWSGTYTVNSCVQTGDFVAEDLCGTPFNVGNTLSAAINFFTQSVAALTGQTLVGSLFSESFTATVAANGTLSFQVNAPIPDTAVRVAQAWQLNITQAGQLTGTVTQTVTEPTLTGQAVAVSTLSTFTQSSQTTMRADTAPGTYASPIDAVRALLRGR